MYLGSIEGSTFSPTRGRKMRGTLYMYIGVEIYIKAIIGEAPRVLSFWSSCPNPEA